MRVMERIGPGQRIAGPENIQLPAGYVIEPLVTDLNYPTAVSWDPDGNLLVAESQFPYGRCAPTEIRVLRRGDDGLLTPVIGGLSEFITDITVYNGLLFLSQRGRISVVEDGRIRDLLTGLPSWGMHHNNAVVFDVTGRMYFGQGTVSNSGVVDAAALALLQPANRLGDHDVPGANVVLTGQNYEVTNPATNEMRPTGAFSPWGTPTPEKRRAAGPRAGQVASGAIMTARWDGADLRVYAWGFRNPFGLAFGPDGHLYATNNGANLLPPRKIAGDQDTFWRVEAGRWYGWPDYYGGLPVTEPQFRPPDGPPHEFLIANRDELLRGEVGPPPPLVNLGMNVSADKFDFCLHPEFGFRGQAFVAEFGPMLAALGGAPPDLPVGRKVVRIDLAERSVRDFAVNRDGLHPSSNGNRGGLERPLEAKFGPDGNLHIVDYGVLEWEDGMWAATAGTGIVWKVSPTG